MNTLRVSWAANPPAEQILTYELFQSKDGGAFVSLGSTPATSRDLQLNDGAYRFKVKARNVAGASVESDIGDGPTVPSKPATPTIETIIP